MDELTKELLEKELAKDVAELDGAPSKGADDGAQEAQSPVTKESAAQASSSTTKQSRSPARPKQASVESKVKPMTKLVPEQVRESPVRTPSRSLTPEKTADLKSKAAKPEVKALSSRKAVPQSTAPKSKPTSKSAQPSTGKKSLPSSSVKKANSKPVAKPPMRSVEKPLVHKPVVAQAKAKESSGAKSMPAAQGSAGAKSSSPSPNVGSSKAQVPAQSTTVHHPMNKDPKNAQAVSDDVATSRWIFGVSLALIVLLFVGLYYAGTYYVQSKNTLVYNGVEFTKDATHWNFDWQKGSQTYSILLRFNPLEAQQVPVKGVLDPKFNKLAPIYVTFDPVSPSSNFTYLALGQGELAINLVEVLGKKVEGACAVNGTDACMNRTIVNCENSNGKAVIFLKTEEPSGIFIKDTCIVIQGKDMDLVRGIDRLLYQWYGII